MGTIRRIFNPGLLKRPRSRYDKKTSPDTDLMMTCARPPKPVPVRSQQKGAKKLSIESFILVGTPVFTQENCRNLIFYKKESAVTFNLKKGAQAT